MTILAFDCAGASCSVAVWRDGLVLAHRAVPSTHGQAEKLLPMIEAALAEAKLGYAGLAAIATTVGPGSFTGLRAGLAAARGFALATGLPAVGISTLEVAARMTAPEERDGRSIVAAIDTRRDDLFVQCFDSRLQALGDGVVRSVADAAAAIPAGRILLTGDATHALHAALKQGARDIVVSRAAGPLDARVIAAIAANRLHQGKDLPPLRPLYMRAPDVTPAPERRR